MTQPSASGFSSRSSSQARDAGPSTSDDALAPPSELPLLPAPQKPKRMFKIVVIGDAAVGKTSLRNRYIAGSFSSSYRATIGVDFVSKTVFLDDEAGTKVVLSIWDTAGQERFRSLASSFYRGADACVLVFSDRTSLANLRTWYDDFRSKRPLEDDDVTEFPWVAVGAKSDVWQEPEGSPLQDDEVYRVLGSLLPARSSQPTAPQNGQLSRPGSPLSPAIECGHPSATPPDPPSQIHVKSPRRPDCCNHSDAKQLRSKRSIVSDSNASIYHTPSSSLNDIAARLSTESLSSEQTVMPGTPSTTASSTTDMFRWTDSGQHFASEQAKEQARGVDVFMASSPPRTPRSVIDRDRTKYRGGPSVFPQDEEDEEKQSRRDGEPPASERASPQLSQETRVREWTDNDFSQDGIKYFRTSAKTGEGVEELFDYLARRMTWKALKDQAEHKSRRLGIETVDLEQDKKGRSKWAEACCG